MATGYKKIAIPFIEWQSHAGVSRIFWWSVKNICSGFPVIFTDAILSFCPSKDRRSLYRQIVQDFSGEEESMWEDFRHGLLFGSQEFVDRIKKKRVLREKNSEKLFLEAASFLGVDLRDLGMAMKRSAAYSGWDFPLGIYGYPR